MAYKKSRQVAPIGTIFSTGMGNDSVMTMIFFFMVAAVLEENGIVQFLSAWLLRINNQQKN